LQISNRHNYSESISSLGGFKRLRTVLGITKTKLPVTHKLKNLRAKEEMNWAQIPFRQQHTTYSNHVATTKHGFQFLTIKKHMQNQEIMVQNCLPIARSILLSGSFWFGVYFKSTKTEGMHYISWDGNAPHCTSQARLLFNTDKMYQRLKTSSGWILVADINQTITMKTKT